LRRPGVRGVRTRADHTDRCGRGQWPVAEVNGMLVDMREMPREVQVIAYEKGLILYIPAVQE
jgi:hypothetical protein